MSVTNTRRLTIRWTIGDVRLRGFEMLRLSIAGALQIFGPEARYVVCVNSVSVKEARARTGALPRYVEWREVTRRDVPELLGRALNDSLIEGMGWKLVPLRVDPQRYELSLDNECILWRLPDGMRRWLECPHVHLIAEDASRCFGSFDPLCAPGAWNAGIRGLAPGSDLEDALDRVLRARSVSVRSDAPISAEIEEQGLQIAAISAMGPFLNVSTRDVTICSPFWPGSPELGLRGAHFAGMNAAHLPWRYYDRSADDWLQDHWERRRPELYRRVGLSPAADKIAAA